MGSTVWAALASLLEVLGQAVVNIPIGIDRLSVLGRYGGYLARFREKPASVYFSNTLPSFEIYRWGLTWKDPHSRLLLCFEIVLKDPHFIAIITMSQTRLDRLTSNFFSTDVHFSTLTLLCSSVKL